MSTQDREKLIIQLKKWGRIVRREGLSYQAQENIRSAIYSPTIVFDLHFFLIQNLVI
jgi:hypothetical protein